MSGVGAVRVWQALALASIFQWVVPFLSAQSRHQQLKGGTASMQKLILNKALFPLSFTMLLEITLHQPHMYASSLFFGRTRKLLTRYKAQTSGGDFPCPLEHLPGFYRAGNVAEADRIIFSIHENL